VANGERIHFPLFRNRCRYFWQQRRWAGLARSVLWFLIGHNGEDCQECGSRYRRWWSPQPLWDELVGTYGGLLCLDCFDRKAVAAGYRLVWTPVVTARHGVPTSNHWLDPVRDRLLMGEPTPDAYEVGAPSWPWNEINEAMGWNLPSLYPEGAWKR